MLALLLWCVVARAAIVDYGPPQDVIGNWKFDLYDASNAQRGTTSNPLNIALPPGASTAALQSAGNASLASLATALGEPPSYSATIANLGLPNGATDMFTISGSSSRVIRITRVVVNGTQTTTSQRDVLIYKRSSLNTGGTSATINSAIVAHDPSDPAATATVRYYTANATTLGTAVGIIRARKVNIGATSANSDEMVIDFGENNTKPILLRGVNDLVAINFNGQNVTGSSISMSFQWTEDSQ